MKILECIQRWYVEGLIGRELSDYEWKQIKEGKRLPW